MIFLVVPDMGTWTYSYNALGKLVSQTDAKGQTSTMVYDSGLSGADKSTNSIILHSNKILLFVFKVWQGCLLNSKKLELTVQRPLPIMNGGQSLRIAIGMLLFTR
jgi:YD repeat-containing protein